jgi:hypothetical protein
MRLAVLSDLHARFDLLEKALGVCRGQAVDGLVVLGDLVDRADQADACVAALRGWVVAGVAGNHERELADAWASASEGPTPEARAFFGALPERLVVSDCCFCHALPRGARPDPVVRFFAGRTGGEVRAPYRVFFVGDSHRRAAADERGPLDLSGAQVRIDPGRRYVINPGALAAGEFAVWDRAAGVVRFWWVED